MCMPILQSNQWTYEHYFMDISLVTRLSNGSVRANFVLHRTQNLLRGTCSENGVGANQSKYFLSVSNPLICQNDMEEYQKCTILIFKISWG